jgi:hypothetical protein
MKRNSRRQFFGFGFLKNVYCGGFGFGLLTAALNFPIK